MRCCSRRCVRGIRTFRGVADWRLKATFQLEDLFHSVFREVASGRLDASCAVNPSAIATIRIAGICTALTSTLDARDWEHGGHGLSGQ
jgi:hypothetical protein